MNKPPSPSQPPKGKPPAAAKPTEGPKPAAAPKPTGTTKQTAVPPPKASAPPPKPDAAKVKTPPAPPAKAPAPPANLKAQTPAAKTTKLNVKVRYYARARLHRVYPLTVEASQPGLATAPLVVRPLIPGAHVVPAEVKLEPGKKVTFHVTPLAKGKLTDARLDIPQPGKPIVAMPLKMKSVTQRMTWLLLLASFIIPAVLWYFTVYAPLKGYVYQTIGIAAGDGANQQGGAAPQQPDGGAGPAAPPPPPAPGDQGPVTTLKYMSNKPGWVLSHNINEFLKQNVPLFIQDWTATIRPSIVSTLNSNEFTTISPVTEMAGKFDEKRSLLGDFAGAIYQLFCEDEVINNWNPVFWIWFFLLMFTLLSWLTHNPRRAWSRKGFELPEVGDPKTAPLTSVTNGGPKPTVQTPPAKPGGAAPVHVQPKG